MSFTNRQILDFCNTYAEHHAEEYFIFKGNVMVGINADMLASEFIFQHCIDATQHEAAFHSILVWWEESDYNPIQRFKQ